MVFRNKRPPLINLVVAHDAITAHTHTETLNALSKNTLKSLKVRTFFEYPQPTVSTIDHMIHNAARINSFSSAHK